jgi:hypothetical protein
MEIFNAEHLEGIIRIPAKLIIGDWQALEREVDRVCNVAKRGIMAQLIVDRDHYGLAIPNHWRTEYGSEASRGSEEAGTGKSDSR